MMHTLPKEQMERAVALAGLRRQENRCRQSLKCSTRMTDDEINLMGVAGEVAFSYLTGLRMRHEHGEPSHDPDVGEWEVKVTSRPNGSLMVPHHRRHRYQSNTPMVLLYLDRYKFTVLGWAYAGDFVGKPGCLDESLPTPAYVCPELRPWSTAPQELLKA